MFNLYWHQALLWEWLPWQGWRPCFLLSRWAAWHKKQKNSQSVSECCCNSKLKTSYLVVLPIKLQGYTPWGSAFLSVRTLQRPRKHQPSTYKFRAGRSLGNRDLRSCWVGKVVVTSVHCKIESILFFLYFFLQLKLRLFLRQCQPSRNVLASVLEGGSVLRYKIGEFIKVWWTVIKI